MDIIARSKFLRISPKKARLVANSIRKLEPEKALVALQLSDKKTAKPLSKLIASAIANAKNNFGLATTDLSFKSIQVGPGQTYKRYRAASRGRVHPIAKRTANITVVLQGESIKKATHLEHQIADNLQQIDGKESRKATLNQDQKTKLIKKRTR